MERNKVRKFVGKIKLEGINQELLFKGNKGTYLNIEIIEWDSEDKVGNTISIHQQDHRGLLGGVRELTESSVDDLFEDLIEDDGTLSNSSLDWDNYD